MAVFARAALALLAPGARLVLRSRDHRDAARGPAARRPRRAPLASGARAARRALHAVASPAAAGGDGPQCGPRAVDVRDGLVDPACRPGPRGAPGVVRAALGGCARVARRRLARERAGRRRAWRARDAA